MTRHGWLKDEVFQAVLGSTSWQNSRSIERIAETVYGGQSTRSQRQRVLRVVDELEEDGRVTTELFDTHQRQDGRPSPGVHVWIPTD